MNFDAKHLEDLPDKSFQSQSSSESLVVEEKLSIQSESIKSAISSAKSASAADVVPTIKTIGLRKLLSAH